MARTALVTGGTGGLGTAVTRALRDDGWQVVVPWRSEKELSRLGEDTDGITLIQADLTDPDSVRETVAAAGPDLRAVINLVGGFAIGKRMHETPVDDFERMLRLNLRPTYLVCQAAIPVLMAGGGGSVVCVSAQATQRPYAGAAGYITAKTAILGLVAALHAEYAKDKVRVNAILPLTIDTPANRASQPDVDPTKWTKPADIANTIVTLCSDATRTISGAHIPV